MSNQGLATCGYLYFYLHLYFCLLSKWLSLQSAASNEQLGLGHLCICICILVCIFNFLSEWVCKVQQVMSSQGLATCGQSLWALGGLMALIACPLSHYALLCYYALSHYAISTIPLCTFMLLSLMALIAAHYYPTMHYPTMHYPLSHYAQLCYYALSTIRPCTSIALRCHKA